MQSMHSSIPGAPPTTGVGGPLHRTGRVPRVRRIGHRAGSGRTSRSAVSRGRAAVHQHVQIDGWRRLGAVVHPTNEHRPTSVGVTDAAAQA